ncbi:MAG: Fur family transcriptional regulator [Thermoanaerobaculaceae bacterium]
MTTEERLEEKLIEALKAHKHSVTSQRIMIFRALARRRDHPTADELHEQLLSEQAPDLSLATVYKNLHLFQKIGLVRAVASPDGRARFDVPMLPHHHLFCILCGSIVDVEEGVRIELAPFLEQETGFRITGAELVLEGVCAKCQLAYPGKRGFRRSRRERQNLGKDRPSLRRQSF